MGPGPVQGAKKPQRVPQYDKIIFLKSQKKAVKYGTITTNGLQKTQNVEAA